MDMRTSDIRWYVPGTYVHDDTDPIFNDRMACPCELAREWMVQFLRTDRTLFLDARIWKASVDSQRLGIGTPMPKNLSCLNGFRIYVGLINRTTDRRWQTRFEKCTRLLAAQMHSHHHCGMVR